MALEQDHCSGGNQTRGRRGGWGVLYLDGGVSYVGVNICGHGPHPKRLRFIIWKWSHNKWVLRNIHDKPNDLLASITIKRSLDRERFMDPGTLRIQSAGYLLLPGDKGGVSSPALCPHTGHRRPHGTSRAARQQGHKHGPFRVRDRVCGGAQDGGGRAELCPSCVLAQSQGRRPDPASGPSGLPRCRGRDCTLCPAS